jgi:hypothetical protein
MDEHRAGSPRRTVWQTFLAGDETNYPLGACTVTYCPCKNFQMLILDPQESEQFRAEGGAANPSYLLARYVAKRAGLNIKYMHGDPIISGVESEREDKRPSCGWPITEHSQGASSTRQCGSEDRVYSVKGRGRFTDRPRETPICAKHLNEAWKKWNVDSAVPLDTKGKE